MNPIKINVPDANLSSIMDTHRPKNDNVLFIGNSAMKYVYMFANILLPDDMEKYFDDKRIFFSALPKELLKKCLYRLYVDCGWDEKTEVSKITTVRFIEANNSTATKWMQKCKMVVVDYENTPHWQALAINAPLICYWDHDVWLQTPEGDDRLAALREAGILFRTPKEAAKKLIDVFDNAAGWWHGSDVQYARLYCLDGMCSKSWLKKWVAGFKWVGRYHDMIARSRETNLMVRIIEEGVTHEAKYTRGGK